MNFKDFLSATDYARRLAKTTGSSVAVKPSDDGWEVTERLPTASKVGSDNQVQPTEGQVSKIESPLPSPSRPPINSRLIAKSNDRPGTYRESGLCFICRNATMDKSFSERHLKLFCKSKGVPIDRVLSECEIFADARGEKNFEPLENLYGLRSYAMNKRKRK